MQIRLGSRPSLELLKTVIDIHPRAGHLKADSRKGLAPENDAHGSIRAWPFLPSRAHLIAALSCAAQ
jgi:hypothetical protein